MRKFIVVLTLLLAVVAFAPSADAAVNPCKTPVQMGKQIQDGLNKHKKKITVYSAEHVLLYEDVLCPYIYGRHFDGRTLREKYKWQRGDYNYQCFVQVCAWSSSKEVAPDGTTYYKYVLEPKYLINKAKSDFINKKTKTIAKKIKKKKGDRAKVIAINRWIQQYMTYKITDKYSLYYAYKYKKGQCHHYAHMFYKIAREAGLEARVVDGTVIKRNYYHSWVIVKIGKKWYFSDPTFADYKGFDKKYAVMKVNSKTYRNAKYRIHGQFDDDFARRFPLAR